MEKKLPTFYPKNRKEWRAWLRKYHASKDSIWLIYYKKKSGKPSIGYVDAVLEALCFGWIDSKAKSIDAFSTMQFFSKRKTTSVWSKPNKERVALLIAEGLMTEAGLRSIHIAKENGSWNLLDEVDALIIPADLEEAFSRRPAAKAFFHELSTSVKKNMLQWIKLAKREETRQKRITELVTLAEKKLKPKQFM